MTTLMLAGGQLITPLEQRFTTLSLEDGLIARLGDEAKAGKGLKVLDVSGCYVTPGLIDLQVNGGPSCNLWGDPSKDQFESLRADLARAGTTSFLPTLITDDPEHLVKNLAFLKECGARKRNGQLGPDSKARILGVHLEGPCLSPQRPGVHPPQWLQPLTVALMKRLATDEVALVTLAPELEPDGQTVRFLSEKGITVALGHSNATYEEARRAFGQGIRLMTHTFNALPPLHHRAPGAVGAAFRDCLVSCCLICDGAHVDPTMVRLAITAKGVAQVVLVTDAASVGTSEGGLVGSSICLADAVRNLVSWGIVGFAQAVEMATVNAARAIGLDDRLGKIAPGYAGDLVVWDKKSLAVRHVIVSGQLLTLCPG